MTAGLVFLEPSLVATTEMLPIISSRATTIGITLLIATTGVTTGETDWVVNQVMRYGNAAVNTQLPRPHPCPRSATPVTARPRPPQSLRPTTLLTTQVK